MARLDMSLVTKIVNNELFSDITKEGFLYLIIPKNNLKYHSNYMYFDNICFYIKSSILESSYTINNAYNINFDNNISLKQLEDKTLSIKQLVLLLQNIYPNKYRNNLIELNNSYFIIEIK